MAAAPLITITYRKEARVLQYERQLYADLGRFYLGGTPAARADWAARRAWTTQRAGVVVEAEDEDGEDEDEAALRRRRRPLLADAVARLYRDARAPEAEPEARGDRACGLAIQEARRRFGRELSRDDVRLMRDVGYSLAEMVAYLAQFDDDDDDAVAAAGPRLKVFSDAELEEQGYAVRALSNTPTTPTTAAAGYSPTPTASEPRTVPRSGGAATTAWTPPEEKEEEEEEQAEEEEQQQQQQEEDEEEGNEDDMPTHHHHDGAGRRFDLPAAYRHLVSPLDSHDADDDADPFVDGGGGGGSGAVVTVAALARALREPDAASPRPAGLPHLPMPAAGAAAWQKEAVAVCRLLLPRVARRLETVRRQLAILERPPPSLSSSSSSSRARFRQRGGGRRSRGSPYKSSPLASG